MSYPADTSFAIVHEGLHEHCLRCDSMAIVQCSVCGALCCLRCDLPTGGPCECGHPEQVHEAVHGIEANRSRTMAALSKSLADSKKE